MNSTVKKRSIVIGSHKTSVSLEDSFWTSLRQIARQRATTVPEVVRTLNASRQGGNLSSAIRVFVLDHYRNNVASTALSSRATQFGQLSDQNARLSVS
jgi:predicted DNA-binding ribbon-helix-helix protein